MKTSYVKELSTGRILTSTGNQDENNPIHVSAINRFVTSRGWNPVDYEVGFDTQEAVEAMMASAITPMEVWEKQMRDTDSTTPRWFEDYITESSVTLAPGRAKDSYDAKVALRAGRPV